MDAGSGMKEKRVTGTIVQSSRRIWPRQAANYFYFSFQASLNSDHELFNSYILSQFPNTYHGDDVLAKEEDDGGNGKDERRSKLDLNGGKADLAITKLPTPVRKIVECQRQAADAVITMFRHNLQLLKKGPGGFCNSLGFEANRKQLQRKA